jgi:K+-sensing histidine kinase KdpD
MARADQADTKYNREQTRTRVLRWSRDYGVAIASVAASACLRFALNPIFGQRTGFILFFPALVLSAWTAGWTGGISAIALSSFAAVYFFTRPRFSLLVDNPTDQATLIVFVFVGLAVSYICNAQRKSHREAVESAERALASEIALRESEARYGHLLQIDHSGFRRHDSPG